MAGSETSGVEPNIVEPKIVEPTPDTKDWTWVLERSCPACGFHAAATAPGEVAGRLRRDAEEWATRLAGPSATTRPAPGVWSVLEYGCHVRDVHRVFGHRVHLMLSEHDPRFPNWDQDEAALTEDYGSQRPAVVADDVRQAANDVAAVYEAVPDGGWSRRGLRSNGSEFTIASIALYHLHDIVHHAWDVTPRV